QDAQKVIGYGGQARGIVNAKVLAYRETQVVPVIEEIKESAIAILNHTKNRAQGYLQGLLEQYVARPLASRWAVHRYQVEDLRGWVAQFTNEKLVEAPAVEPEPEQASVAEDEEQISEVEESPVAPLHPSEEDDSLEDELSIPEDPAPVPAKRRTTRKATASMAERRPVEDYRRPD
ncbi:MAG: hypothetical protein HC936_07435, partial [Leptolyngbyaceae cyanobacterium SU_3_3]|nr:hypothetical protein [Leptolyngbyaceae cyanobacterium SU_3_3]